MHMVLDGVDWKASLQKHAGKPDILWIRAQLEGYRSKGFTYLRDGGDRWGAGKAARAVAGEYGITYRTPLSPLHKAGHYGGFIGEGFADEKEFVRLVRKNKAHGADFIKIMLSGLMDFDRFGVLTEQPLDPKEIRLLVGIAHDEGMAVMVHANGAETVTAAAESGVDSVEHGAYLNEDALYAMYQAGTVWVPTLSTVGNLRGKGRFSETAVQEILENAMENVRAFANMGGLIAPGTDAGAWAVPHGSETEYALLAEAGVSAEALARGVRAIQEKF